MDKDKLFGMPIDNTDEPFYFGKYNSKGFDSKNRLHLPVKLHKSLDTNLDTDKKVSLIDLEDCFAIMNKESWLLYYNYLTNMEEKLDLVEFAADTYQAKVDNAGRIVVPGELKDKTINNDSVDMVGFGKSILVINHEEDVDF